MLLDRPMPRYHLCPGKYLHGHLFTEMITKDELKGGGLDTNVILNIEVLSSVGGHSMSLRESEWGGCGYVPMLYVNTNYKNLTFDLG